MSSYRIRAIDAGTAVGEKDKEGDLPGVVQAGCEGQALEPQHRRAVEGIVHGYDTVGDRIVTGEDTDKARTIRKVRSDGFFLKAIPPGVEGRGPAKSAKARCYPPLGESRRGGRGRDR